jgi:hypothetical protein
LIRVVEIWYAPALEDEVDYSATVLAGRAFVGNLIFRVGGVVGERVVRQLAYTLLSGLGVALGFGAD